MAWSVALEGTTDCAAAMVMRESMHHDAQLAKAIVLQTGRNSSSAGGVAPGLQGEIKQGDTRRQTFKVKYCA